MSSRTLELKFITDHAKAIGGMSTLRSHVGKLAGAFAGLAVAGAAADFMKDATKAAMADQAQMAILKNQVGGAGVSWKKHGQAITDFIDKANLASGFLKTDLSEAFGRLVTATHSSAEATKLMGDAENLARARHISLVQASTILVKVHQGNSAALKRLGVDTVTVTTKTDALKLAHQRLLAAGHKLTEKQKELYQTQLIAAKAADKHATALANLATIHKSYAGASDAYAHTSAGAMARLQAAWEAFQVEIGDKVLPILSKVTDFLLKNVPEAMEKAKKIMAEITTFMRAAWKAWGHDITEVAKIAWKVVTDIFRAVKPLLTAEIKAIGDILTGKWGAAWDQIKKIPGAAFHAMVGIMGTLATNVLEPAAARVGKALWNGFTGALSGLANWATGLLKGAVNAMIRPVNDFMHSLASHWPDIPGAPGPPGFLSSGIPYLARGGIVTRPTLAMIGEAGPEAVIPLGRGGAGYGGITINFYETPANADPHAIASAVAWRLRSLPA